jgi:hypothetical protein
VTVSVAGVSWQLEVKFKAGPSCAAAVVTLSYTLLHCTLLVCATSECKYKQSGSECTYKQSGVAD